MYHNMDTDDEELRFYLKVKFEEPLDETWGDLESVQNHWTLVRVSIDCKEVAKALMKVNDEVEMKMMK